MKKIIVAYQKDDKKIFYLSPRSPINVPTLKEAADGRIDFGQVEQFILSVCSKSVSAREVAR